MLRRLIGTYAYTVPNHYSTSAVTMGCTLSKASPESGDGKPKSHRRRRQEKQASRKQNSYHAPPAVTAVSTATSNRAQVAPRFPGVGKRLDSGPSKVYSSNSGGRIYAPGDPNHPSRRPVSKAFRQKYAHHYNPAIEMPQLIIVSRVSLQFLNLTRGVVRLKGYPLWTRFGGVFKLPPYLWNVLWKYAGSNQGDGEDNLARKESFRRVHAKR